MNTTHMPTMKRVAAALGLAALSAAATLGLGAGTAAADRDVCECANGEHTPHSTVPGLRDDFNPQPEPPGREHRGDHSVLTNLSDGFNPQPEPPGRHGSLTSNHSLTTARARRSVGY